MALKYYILIDKMTSKSLNISDSISNSSIHAPGELNSLKRLIMFKDVAVLKQIVLSIIGFSSSIVKELWNKPLFISVMPDPVSNNNLIGMVLICTTIQGKVLRLAIENLKPEYC